MVENISALLPTRPPMALAILVILLIVIGVLVFLLAKLIVRGNKEKQRLRLEVGKVADELQQLKSKMEPSQKSN